MYLPLLAYPPITYLLIYLLVCLPMYLPTYLLPNNSLTTPNLFFTYLPTTYISTWSSFGTMGVAIGRENMPHQIFHESHFKVWICNHHLFYGMHACMLACLCNGYHIIMFQVSTRFLYHVK
jgi:hypothetical protein